jgi:hypothetical protein
VNATWYLRRAAAMSPGEAVGRLRDRACQLGHQVGERRPAELPAWRITAPVPLPPGTAGLVSRTAERRLLDAADVLLEGTWTALGSSRSDLMPSPDWFADPARAVRFPDRRYAFRIDIRRGDEQRSLKPVWELSRHHHTTLLASAYHQSGDERYALAAAGQLESWWAANPFLRGINWTSGIEVGVRLVSWVWTRRLLDGWDGASVLFEDNPRFVRQLHDHQRFLAAFPSRHSSANNHRLAEAAGQFVVGCAFAGFPISARWRQEAARVLSVELARQTFPSGLHRELATAYHSFVLELGLVAAIEGDAAGFPLPEATWDVLRRMIDATASVVDGRRRPPRQGDDDEGHALFLDPPGPPGSACCWDSLLATGQRLFGRAPWWPDSDADDVRTPLWTALCRPRPAAAARRRPRLSDAGTVILRAAAEKDRGELWCRVDHGPHGYLSIAAHAHADALSLEVRHDGVDILADPGTYCYQGNPHWRSYFRSTIAHNTLEVDGVDQSRPGGPFLWTDHAVARLAHVSGVDAGPVAEWRASHDGYRRLDHPAVHHRCVRLDRITRRLEIRDRLETATDHAIRLAFHLGPAVGAELQATSAELCWIGEEGCAERAVFVLPPELDWTSHCGEVESPLGWYSPRFGKLLPAVTLLGTGRAGPGVTLVSVLAFEARPVLEEAAS